MGWTPETYWRATPLETILAIRGYRYAQNRKLKTTMLWDREKIFVLMMPHLKKGSTRDSFMRTVMPFTFEKHDPVERPGRDPETAKRTREWLDRVGLPKPGKELTVSKYLMDKQKRQYGGR